MPRAGPPRFEGEHLQCYNGRVPAGNRAHEVAIGPVSNLGKEPISRALRDYGIRVVGPGARPYRRSRLFASLAEQLGSAITDEYLYNIRQLERATFNAIQDASGESRFDVYGFDGRRTVVALLRIAKDLARSLDGVKWLDATAQEVGRVLVKHQWLPPKHEADYSA